MSKATIPFYHEAQSSPDTCFVHATNMYFQRSYINSAFIPQYRELVSTVVGKIQELVSAGALNTFYGEFPAPNNASTEDDVSLPEKDSDLSGYYEMYTAFSSMPLQLLDDMEHDGMKELDPVHVLFLLEFQISQDGHLLYVPHRFYHRYARSTQPGDTRASAQRFAESIAAAPENTPFYLCRVQTGSAHAFSARKCEGNTVVLLDSLYSDPVQVASAQEFMERYEIAGRASCLILPDGKRNTVQLV